MLAIRIYIGIEGQCTFQNTIGTWSDRFEGSAHVRHVSTVMPPTRGEGGMSTHPWQTSQRETPHNFQAYRSIDRACGRGPKCNLTGRSDVVESGEGSVVSLDMLLIAAVVLVVSVSPVSQRE